MLQTLSQKNKTNSVASSQPKTSDCSVQVVSLIENFVHALQLVSFAPELQTCCS